MTLPQSQSGLYKADLHGGQPERLDFDVHTPDWSPDGSQVAYVDVEEDGDPPQIWVMNADGTNQRQLTQFDDAAEYPSWSHDGTHIAFIRGRWSDDFPDAVEVYVMAADGSDQRQVTDNESPELWVAWSSDGRRVAVTKSGEEGLPSMEIAIVAVATGAERDITPEVVPDGWIDWSPTGDRLAFTSSLTSPHVWTMSSKGSEVTELALDADVPQARQPVWSPDGTQIAFLTGRDGGVGRVYVMSATGGEARAVVEESWYIVGADWIP